MKCTLTLLTAFFLLANTVHGADATRSPPSVSLLASLEPSAIKALAAGTVKLSGEAQGGKVRVRVTTLLGESYATEANVAAGRFSCQFPQGFAGAPKLGPMLLYVDAREANHSQAGAPGALSDRDFLEAVLYLNRVGCPCRDLPAELGYWHAIYMRFRRWEKRGVRQRLWKNLQTGHFAQARVLFMDSTTIRAHPHAAGAPKNHGPDQALGRSRGGWSTKIHAATTDENYMAALHLTPGEAHDGRQSESLYESLDPDNVPESAALDKGYDADRIRERLATRYDKLRNTFLSALCLVAASS